MKPLMIMILSCCSPLILAAQTCDFFSNDENNKHYSSTWQWGDHYLGCGKTTTQINDKNSLHADQLLVIRGHQSEIDTKKFKIIAQSHGYYLVKTTATPTDNYLLATDNHLEFITLNDFNSITQPHINKLNQGTNELDGFVNQVNATRWRDDIITLSSWSRRTGEVGNVAAANWIETQLTDLGYQASQQSFQAGSTTTNNIIAIKPGTSRPDDWYLIGAHMDSIPTGNAPGALDNASGCSAVLELATIAKDFEFEGTVIFICFSGEEQGLFGSEFHADGLVNDGDDEKIKLALTLDMVGYTSNTDHDLLLESSFTHQTIMNEMTQLAAIYAPDLTVFTSTNYFGSDHVSYIDNGMPGILSIDDDWNVYPDYHQSSDLPENINLTQGEYILKTNAAMLASKAVVIFDSDLIFSNGFE